MEFENVIIQLKNLQWRSDHLDVAGAHFMNNLLQYKWKSHYHLGALKPPRLIEFISSSLVPKSVVKITRLGKPKHGISVVK